MEAMSRADIIEALVAAGNRRDRAVQYADAFLEYVTASDNILRHGAVVAHPRTSNPITNPFLVVRDGALRKLQHMRDVVGVESLWLNL